MTCHNDLCLFHDAFCYLDYNRNRYFPHQDRLFYMKRSRRKHINIFVVRTFKKVFYSLLKYVCELYFSIHKVFYFLEMSCKLKYKRYYMNNGVSQTNVKCIKELELLLYEAAGH